MSNLVLMRKAGERIRIADDIWVTVIKIRSGDVKLGIEAPRDVNIVREELLPPSEFRHLPENTQETT
jgi:carbon storage regulator